jgi:LuxR family transcriptional regulator, maltose regulon positive regulatory protein
MHFSPGVPISKIKVRIPPRRDELLTRERLINGLYDQLDKPLLFVVAPAGYGKTSLLVDLAWQSEMPFCWLSLDALDQEPQRFLRYLIAAIAERFPEFGRDSLATLESMTSFAADEERLLITISNEVHSAIRTPFVLVLDDYHLVESSAGIGQILTRLLHHSGEILHLVIASRKMPDMVAAPLMIARNQVGGLSFEDLAFQTEEIQQLFQNNHNRELSREEAEEIVRETEGWIAAIYLTKDSQGSLPRFHPLETTTILFDFFSREVMERQPEEMQHFMLMTSMFDAFDAALCKKVLSPLAGEDQPDWVELFRKVRANSLFSIPLDSDEHWMRYHHLFQHYLRSKLQYDDPALAWNIQQNLARTHEEEGQWEEALQIYDHLNDYQNLIRVLSKAGFHFIGSGRILTLDSWLKKLPIELLYSQPVLISLLGSVHATQGDSRQALGLLNQAEIGLRNTELGVEWITTLVRRAEVYRQLGQFDASLLDIEKILATVGDSPKREFHIHHAEALRIRGLALFGMGRVQNSLPWLEESLRRYKQLGQGNQIPILETELGVVHRRLGELEVSARYFASALQTLESAGNNGWKSRLLNNMGMLKYTTGQLLEAHSLLRDAVGTAEQCGYVRIQTNALITLGDLLTDMEDLESAYSCYDQALTHASHLGHALYIFYASLGEARLKRMGGDPALALDELRLVELSQIHLGSYERAIFNLEKGRCQLELDRLDDAESSLFEAVKLFEDGGNLTEKKLAGFWHGIAGALHTSQHGITGLQELVPPQREWRTPTPLMIHAGYAARWLKLRKHTRLLRDGSLRIFLEHARRLLDNLAELRNTIHRPVDETAPPAPRLEITTFGAVRILHDGRQLKPSDWQTREARDLFLYLLQSPPRTKEQIAVDFWPDLPPARLRTRFKINIHRIRKALGQDVIQFKGEHYTFNHSIPYYWDRAKFNEEYQASKRRTIIQERIESLERAVATIGGRYLEDLDAPWAEADRLLYEERQREVMLELAELYLKKKRAKDCLDMARSLLTLDPLMESAHRLVLQACAAQHDPAGLAKQYRHYQQIMEEELGMLPSLEMRTLYEKLLTSI